MKSPQCFTLNSEALPFVWSSEPRVPSVIDFKTSMTLETVEAGTTGLGQTLRTGRPLVGRLSFHGVSGLCQKEFRPRA